MVGTHNGHKLLR